jgi:hypothetical protein
MKRKALVALTAAGALALAAGVAYAPACNDSIMENERN